MRVRIGLMMVLMVVVMLVALVEVGAQDRTRLTPTPYVVTLVAPPPLHEVPLLCLKPVCPRAGFCPAVCYPLSRYR